MIIILKQKTLIDGKVYDKGEIVQTNDSSLGKVLVSEKQHEDLKKANKLEVAKYDSIKQNPVYDKIEEGNEVKPK